MILRSRSRSAGAAAVEFALVLPLLLAVIFAAIEFSFVLYDKLLITQAGREAARYGVVAATPKRSANEIRDRALDFCSRAITISGSPCTTSNIVVSNAEGLSDSLLTVEINFTYQGLMLGALMESLGKPIQLRAITEMKHE